MKKEIREVIFDRELDIEGYRFRGLRQQFPNHFHEYYVIGLIEHGKRKMLCNQKEYIVKPGDLILLNPMDSHTCAQIEQIPLDYRCLNIKVEVMKKIVLELTGQPYLPVFSKNLIVQAEETELLFELHKMIMKSEEELKREEAFYFLMEQLISHYTQQISLVEDIWEKEIEEVCHYIEEHYQSRVTLEEMCHVTGFEKFQLIRMFTKEKGITPYRYVETIRINRSKELLELGKEPIDVAIQTGFTDQSHFTRFFKKQIGLTPKQYQNIF